MIVSEHVELSVHIFDHTFLGHILPNICQSDFKLNEKVILFQSKFRYSESYKSLHKFWQMPCDGMCKILQWSESQELNKNRTWFSLNHRFELNLLSEIVRESIVFHNGSLHNPSLSGTCLLLLYCQQYWHKINSMKFIIFYLKK